MKRAELLAIAALAVSGTGMGPHPHPHPYPFYEATPRKRRPQVQRLVTSSSAEIKAWNAAVDARKAAKKEQQP